MRVKASVSLLLAFVSTAAEAQCQNSPLSTQTANNLSVLMVTMNRLGVASYASGSLRFFADGRRFQLPANWQSVSPLAQLFNDRYAASHSDQNFDINQADKVSLSFTIGESPKGTITLLSHANGTSTFPLTCSSSGIVQGVTGDVEYLFYFSPQYPIQ